MPKHSSDLFRIRVNLVGVTNQVEKHVQQERDAESIKGDQNRYDHDVLPRACPVRVLIHNITLDSFYRHKRRISTS